MFRFSGTLLLTAFLLLAIRAADQACESTGRSKARGSYAFKLELSISGFNEKDKARFSLTSFKTPDGQWATRNIYTYGSSQATVNAMEERIKAADLVRERGSFGDQGRPAGKRALIRTKVDSYRRWVILRIRDDSPEELFVFESPSLVHLLEFEKQVSAQAL